jgi:glycosyltransferase involved in cell wall biosynthesis
LPEGHLQVASLMPSLAKPSLLVISQVYVPDPASVGQHMADAAEALADRGYRVLVMTSATGYDNPKVRYPRHEFRGGVEITRLPLSSFGKRSLPFRLLGQGLFLLQVIFRGLFVRRLAGILVSTSPPMASFAALVIGQLRRVPITYWLMDLNPDQTVVLGKVSARSPLVLAMKWLNRAILARAAEVMILDHYMAKRVEQQYPIRGRVVVLPPWPHEQQLDDVPPASNPFRAEHGLGNRFVVMYSGNHSLASPLTTLIEAALRMRDEQHIMFVFVGGGLGKREVDEAITAHRPANMISLPYQPLDQIKYSLSAADLHVVTLGEKVVGINHPCKIYGAMAVGRPILLIGPRPSHAADLIERHKIGWQIEHGDVSGVVEALRRILSLSASERVEMGQRARAAIRDGLSKDRLCTAFCDVVERALQPATDGAIKPAYVRDRLPSGPPSGVVVSSGASSSELV